jgi:alkylhydroperoxidase family enzyme
MGRACRAVCREGEAYPRQIEATVHGGDADWTVDEQALLELCDELDAKRTISDALWERSIKHFTPEQIIEIIALVGFYRTVALHANALDLPREPFAARFPGPVAR